MGNMIVRTWDNFWEPELQPVPYGPVTFDPHFGFEEKRVKRVMIATEQELRACKISKEKWDYCSHKLLALYKCRADVWPFIWKCKNESAGVSRCYYDDYILRMKEYERERRLRHRQHRIEEKSAQGA